uniref:PCI domain-containing protein n=1 Tax=Setaria digitata TaxID=48799 RepID=A0A915Q4N1_9BILA
MEVQDPSVQQLIALVSAKIKENDEEELKRREELIMRMAEKMSNDNDIDGNFVKILITIEGLTKLSSSLRPHLLSYGMAKAVKLIRNLIDLCLKIGRDSDFKFALCTEYVNWAKEQNRIFLRHMLEVRLMRLLNEIGRHVEVLTMSSKLTNELKKVEDKDIQLEVYIEECKAAFALNNMNRSRSALVAARTIANSLCIDTKLQARLDMESGILNMAEDHDFKTAYSYFYEAFENFDTNKEVVHAQKALKYMCLAKIMLNEEAEIPSLLSSKLAVKYSGRDLDAMKIIAEAFQNRSLENYYKAFEEYHVELQSDLLIREHVDSLTDAILEKDISRAIEPYSIIEMATLAKNIRLPVERVEKKLAQMILDQKLQGIIDQQDATLTVYNFPQDVQMKTFNASVEVIRGLSEVIF